MYDKRTYDALSEKTDRHLAETLKAGDEGEKDAALTILSERHKRSLTRYIQGQLGNDKDSVDDVMQETWKTFFENAQITDINQVVGYIIRIARNKCIDLRRKFRAETTLHEHIPSAARPEDIVLIREDREEQERLIDFLKRVPFRNKQLAPCQQLVWVLQEQCSLPRSVIARLLGTNVHNVEATWSQTTHKIRSYCASDQFRLDEDYQGFAGDIR